MKISEPFKSDIIKIIESNKDSESLIQSLKLYILSNKNYFKELMPGYDVAWLAKEIHRQVIKNRRIDYD